MKKTLAITSSVIVLFLTFLPGIQKTCRAVMLDRIVATVNEEVITWSELMSTIIIDGRQFLEGKSSNEREDKIRELERPFLSKLIEMKLQLQVAQQKNLSVDDLEVDGAIGEIMKKYDLTEESLMNSLKAEGLSREDYRTKLADQILLQKVINSEVTNSVVISDQEVEQYYEENRDAYDVEGKMKISQIFFHSPGDSFRKADIEARAKDIVDRIRSGADFARLAVEYSEDPSSEFGGDLGYISRGNALKEVEEAAAALQTGEVSDPFWSSAGLHIIKLEDRVEGGMDRVKNKIKDILFQKSFERKYREWKAGLRERAYIEIKL